MRLRFIDPKTHAVMDYLAVIFLAAAPFLFGYRGTSAAQLAYIAAGLQLTLSLMTAYPLGAFRLIPFPIHGGIELTLGAFLFASPWLLGFSEFYAPRNVSLISGASLFLIWTTTNYEAAVPAKYRIPKHVQEHEFHHDQHHRAA